MRYDPNIHHRRSIRLTGYDYSHTGAYFVTICTHEREMVLRVAAVAEAVSDAWLGIPARFRSVTLDEFVVMPNHVHGVIFLERDVGGGASAVGGASAAPTLADVVRAFKSISAVAANRALGRVGRPFWQRNYYERIIRNEEELEAVRRYIRDNPARWDEDPNNPEAVGAVLAPPR